VNERNGRSRFSDQHVVKGSLDSYKINPLTG